MRRKPCDISVIVGQCLEASARRNREGPISIGRCARRVIRVPGLELRFLLVTLNHDPAGLGRTIIFHRGLNYELSRREHVSNQMTDDKRAPRLSRRQARINRRPCMRSNAIKYNLRVEQRFYARLSSTPDSSGRPEPRINHSILSEAPANGNEKGEGSTERKTNLCLGALCRTPWNFPLSISKSSFCSSSPSFVFG